MNRVDRWLIAGGLIAILAGAVYYHRPSERMLGQADQASYLISALSLAREGRLAPTIPLLTQLPPELEAAVIEMQPPLGLRDAARTLEPRSFFLGWQIDPRSPGNLTARFPPGLPLVLAAAYRILGWPGLLAVNTILLALAGALAVYLAFRWTGALAGFFTGVLWCVFPLNVWIANSTLAEPLVLLLGLAAMAAWMRSRESTARCWPIAIGILVGLGPIVKVDAVPWLVIPLAYAWENRRMSFGHSLLPAFAALPALVCSALVLLAARSDYTVETATAVLRQPVVRSSLAVTAAVVAIALIVWRRRLRTAPRSERVEAPAQVRSLAFSHWCRWAVFAALTVLFAYLLFIRSRSVGTDQYFWAPLGKVVPSLREVTLERLGWYLPPPALYTALLGAAAMLIWTSDFSARVFAAIGVATLLLISYDNLGFPLQPFAMRRYLPQAMPLLLIALAGSAQWLTWRARPLRWRYVALTALIAYTVVQSVAINRTMNSRADAEGLFGKMRDIAEQIGPDAIVLLRESSPLREIAPLLAFGFERDVLPLRIRSAEQRRAATEFLGQQEQAERSLWIWSSSSDDSVGLPATTLAGSPVHELFAPLLRMSTTQPPLSWDTRRWRMSLRRITVTPHRGSSPASGGDHTLAP